MAAAQPSPVSAHRPSCKVEYRATRAPPATVDHSGQRRGEAGGSAQCSIQPRPSQPRTPGIHFRSGALSACPGAFGMATIPCLLRSRVDEVQPSWRPARVPGDGAFRIDAGCDVDGSMAMNERVNGKAANWFVKMTAPELIPRYRYRPAAHFRYVYSQGAQPMSTNFHATPGWNPEFAAHAESNHEKDSDDTRCLNQVSTRACRPGGSICSPLIRCAAAVSHRRPDVRHSR